MSNHLAIAAVTATLKRSLQEALNADVPGAVATMGRPQPAGENVAQGVNVYLYQVMPNAAFRGADLPTRRDGQFVKRPQIGLNLQYLFSFYGNEATLEPQAVLGSVVRALHVQPVLTPEMIAQTLADPTFSFVAASDLPLAVETVKLTPAGLTFEEFSKLWSVLFQIPYVLSVTYEGSVVLLDKSVNTRVVAPVRLPRVRVTTARSPVLVRLLSRGAAAEPFAEVRPIGAGDTLQLQGSHLQGASTRVLFTGDVAAAPATIAADEVTVAIPPQVRAGVQAVAVSVTPVSDFPGEVASNPIAFTLRPRVEGATVGGATLDVQLAPPVGRLQRVTLLLEETPSPAGRPPRGFAVERAPAPPAAPEEANAVSFPRSGIAPGTYLLAVRVDGAESALHVDASTGAYDAPTVSVP